jgi:DUF1009 family protein
VSLFADCFVYHYETIILNMDQSKPDTFALISGRGAYPRILAESARKQGAQRIVAIAFKRETDPVIEDIADETHWVHLGQLAKMLDAMKASNVQTAIMAGQIAPTHLFNMRMDTAMISLLSRLKTRNAETIFGAIADELKNIGIELLPASLFMEPFMPGPGNLSAREPTKSEKDDIDLGISAALATSRLDIGQTVVIKEGTILAVEAFEGTNDTIRRAAKLGGDGSVIVKLAKQGHDMRFDIPVVGTHTIRVLKKAKAAALAVEAGRAILLERDKVIEEANRANIALVAFNRTEKRNEQ